MNTLMHIPRQNLPRAWNREFDNLFEGFFRPTRWSEETASEGMIPALDVVERANEFVVKAEMPGVKKDEIEVSLENGVLTIGAETQSESEVKDGDRVIRQERCYGKYVRSLRIGKEIDEKNVKAAYKDGVLELTLPKAETAKPKKISVGVE